MPLENDLLTAKLNERFAESILTAELHYDILTVTVKQEVVYEVVRFLKEEPTLNFHFLTTMCGLHFPDEALRFGIMYQLHNMQENTRIRIKAFTNDDPPVFKTLTNIWGAANWMEREAYDFYGFHFTGHPDLRRILNVDDMIGWPMRKEYPLEDQNRYDKDDKMFGR